ncbi:MAG: MetQ/NlpA family ABC transporter substrate-binding protein [Erysipelotrichaceae bacterium]|nr:MetQ/NlpA family ABC transporter substrate-binding protein [Erysipelotrichaceae bacterium]MDD3923809.1 MetQ/NlpA family ABC transporter substrate-binding protein [Erysipelotrichaceae bacterium]MDD4641886.1 MetQ/NlpA family ABC transporter substrate-binding protein [Erysipelotrichaceae bacterium]
MKKIVVLLLTLVLSLSLFACSNEEPETEPVVVKVGTVGEYNEYWKPVIALFAEEGVTIELVKFTEYSLPNAALADGDIDMNAFQHYAYLNKEISEVGYELSVICETIVAPLGLYSENITDVSEIKENDTIAIPSDATNGGRALKLLESAGLITVDPEVGYLGVKADIIENPLNLDIVEVDASLTASLLPDVAAAIINGGVAISAGLHKTDQLIFVESIDPQANPNVANLINVLVVRNEDVDNELYNRIADAFQSDAVAEVIHQEYPGVILPAWEVNVE